MYNKRNGKDYRVAPNRNHRHNTEATEEGFVESVQPIIGTILGNLVGDLSGAILCGGLSVVLKNTIKKLVLGGDKTIYADFKNTFLKLLSCKVT